MAARRRMNQTISIALAAATSVVAVDVPEAAERDFKKIAGFVAPQSPSIEPMGRRAAPLRIYHLLRDIL